jgi:hypothetical protein
MVEARPTVRASSAAGMSHKVGQFTHENHFSGEKWFDGAEKWEPLLREEPPAPASEAL